MSARFIILILLGLLPACHKDKVLKPYNRSIRVEEKSDKDVEKTPEYESPVDESVNIPAPITGAYLMCTKIATDAAAMQQKWVVAWKAKAVWWWTALKREWTRSPGATRRKVQPLT
ncbi:MAG: hypothetical protein M3Q07_15190 [Pseudobdellovibrionaceae bacterium]|nr:hypothetical protein [Pseudobdellovibrionaceae bacterium]